MAHEVGAFLRGEEPECGSNAFDDLVESAWAGSAEKRFQFRKRQLDGIEVRAVGRQEPDEGPRAFDGHLRLGLFVDGEVIEDHDVARPEGGHEHLLDVSQKGWLVEGAIEHGGRVEAIPAERRDHRVRLPMPAGGGIAKPQAARAATVPSEQIRGDAGLVEKDVVSGIAQRLDRLPVAPRCRHVSASLFVGVHRFFTVKPKRPIVRHSVVNAAVVGNASRNSANVASGRAVINAPTRASCCGDKTRPRNLVCFRGSIEPVSRRRCTKR